MLALDEMERDGGKRLEIGDDFVVRTCPALVEGVASIRSWARRMLSEA